jgi:hypothetical protein
MREPFLVELSAIDEARFGVRTAKATLAAPHDVDKALDFCRANDVEFVIARCSTQDLNVVQKMEGEGFFLADTLVCSRRSLLKTPIPEDRPQVSIRSFRPGDEVAVRAVAAESFRGYYGHYHADPHLDPAKCDEVYVDWAVRSCLSRKVADEVLIAEDEGAVIGFMTIRLNSADQGQNVLSGVARAAQGRGAYRSFLVQSMNWCLSQSASEMVFVTQVTNTAVQRVWVRLGFEPSHSYYTLHKWFEAG